MASGATNQKPHGTQNAWIRPAVQIGFLVFSLLVGWQFHRFVLWLSNPVGPSPERPAGVEAWLPISSLMSLTYLLRAGQANPVHPAGLVLFTLILTLTLLLGRGFCSWVCPIGALSEWAHRLGRRLCGRNPTLPRRLDVPLRSLKYLLLSFFLYAILGMSEKSLLAFLEGPYNRAADVKMYLFFVNVTRTAVVTLTILTVLSMLVKNFWCRYLCPYGALLALCAWPAPLAVRRDADSCAGCGRCDQACPNRIHVSTCRRVRSLECTTCFRCVEACRVPGALAVSWPAPRRTVNQAVYAAILIGAFVLVSQAAQSIGYWKTSTGPALYPALYRMAPHMDHPRTP
ncbi:MAG TPA: 4Fe-4S binding protein, partial [Thermoguttaceae bacterium]|nr:4Fe-4S binding protein [Thermoguttaceae bacterium]